MFLPPVVSTPQVPRKMGSPMHEESVFYKYNIQNSNLLAATAAFWTFSQKFMKKAQKKFFRVFFFLYFSRIWLAGACLSTKISCCWKRVRIDPLLDDKRQKMGKILIFFNLFYNFSIKKPFFIVIDVSKIITKLQWWMWLCFK